MGLSPSGTLKRIEPEGWPVQWFYATTLLVSATLLFVVQPMFARMVLPLLGGTPAVWNTCMVFYQACLLGGYIYAHLTIHWLGVRRQAVLHLFILCLPWFVLPIGVSGEVSPPAEANPTGWLMTLLSLVVGLPFFVVSASAPMLQAWFAHTGHPAAKDPYFLYAASNLGSMIALLGYPIVVEPALSLTAQSTAWTVGYGLLVVLCFGCAVLLWRSPRGSSPVTAVKDNPDASRRASRSQRAKRTRQSANDATPNAAVAWPQRARWLVLSLVPSSLLLGVTAHISTDIAAVPLLWVVPLALYLLSFVLVFARRTILPHAWMLRLQPFLVLALAVLFVHSLMGLFPLLWLFLHLATFFATCMVCHGELAETRPDPSRLTEFYLWISVGGVLGGAFNALVAPNLFSSIVEYPLVIALACLLRPAIGTAGQGPRDRMRDLVLPAAVLLAFGGLLLGLELKAYFISPGLAAVTLLAAGVIVFFFRKRPLRFALGVGAMFLIGGFKFGQTSYLIYSETKLFRRDPCEGDTKCQCTKDGARLDQPRHTMVRRVTTRPAVDLLSSRRAARSDLQRIARDGS